MYDSVSGVPESAYVQADHRAALAAQRVIKVEVTAAAPQKPDVDRWRDGELQMTSVVRAAQLDRFERSVDGVLQELQTFEERSAFGEIVQQVLLKLDRHFRDAAKSDRDKAEAVEAIAGAFARRGEFDEGLRRYLEARNLYRSADDQAAEAVMLTRAAEMHIRQKNFTRGTERYEEALGLFRKVGDGRSEGRVLVALADLRIKREDWQRAERTAREALQVLKTLGAGDVELDALITQCYGDLAMALFADERYPEAMEALHAAVTTARTMGDRRVEAQILRNMGATAIRLNRHAEAVSHLAAARQIYDEVGDLASKAEMDTLLAHLARAY